VFAFIFFLPTESNRISRLMGLRSKYLGSLPEVYYGRQLIIGCNPTCCAAVETLLQEIFHEDHGLRTEHAVILCPSEPDLEWGSLLLQYASRDKLSFLRGDVQTPGDLRRAGVEYAKCVFILSDRNAVDTRIEDTRTLIRVLTVNECNRHIPIFAQVIHKDSRERVMSLGLESKNVICMEEMNTMMLASACLWHGWPLLVSNLLTCCVPPVHTDEEEETSISVEQYINGMGKEVYMFRKFGKTFAGTNFALAAKEIFSKHGALLFAAARAGQVLLFPGSRFVINPEDKGFLIADDSSVVDEISEPPKSFFNMPSTPKLMDRSSTPNSGRKTPKAGNRSKDFRPAPKNLQGFRFKGARSLSTSGNVSPMRARVRSASCSEKAPEDTEGGVATGSEEEKESEPALAPNNGGIYPTRAVSGLKMSKSHRESQSRRSSNMSIEIEDLDTIDIGMDEDDKDNRTSNLRGSLTRKLSCKPRVGKLSPSRRRSKRIYSEDHKRIQTGHIVLIVHQLDGSMPIFVDFIRSSHFRHLIGCRQVVVICPTLTTTPPRMKAYCEKHSIVLIRADPHRDGMAKARVKSASVVVITNPGHHKSGWPDNEDTAEAMANTETLSILVELLAYAGSSARFVIELSDVAYLNQVGILGARVSETKKNRRKSILKTTRKKSRIQILKDEVSMFTHRQASKKLQNFGVMQIGEGDVVLSNVSELLLAQTLFNENIVDVVSAMLSYTIFEDTLISLCQIQLPSSCTGKEPRTFGYLFSYILETYDALALGIYRIERNDDGTEGFLVITCPSEDFVLRPQDEVFVFCDVAMLEDDSVNNPAVMDDEFSRFSDVMQDDGLTSSDDDKPDAFPAENRTRSSLPQKTQRTLEALNERQTNLELQLGSFMSDVSMALEGIQSSIDQLNSKKQKFGLRSRTKSNDTESAKQKDTKDEGTPKNSRNVRDKKMRSTRKPTEDAGKLVIAKPVVDL